MPAELGRHAHDRGTEGPDDIFVQSLPDGSIRVEANGERTEYRAGIVKAVRILGKGGNDQLGKFGVPNVTIDGGAGINEIDGTVTLKGTERPDRIVVKTTFLGESRVENTVTFTGETAKFEGIANVVLEDFDAKDTVVTDPDSRVRITEWLTTGPTAGARFGELGPPALIVHGTPKNDRMTVKVQRNGPLRISLNGVQAPAIAGSVGAIQVRGGGGLDTIDANVPVQVPSERAMPRALGARPISIRIIAGGGGDRVTCRGKAQRCTVLGGAGDDRINVRDGTRSVVDGGAGFDRVRADPSDRVRGAELVTR
jgi:hypothetical protein